MLTVLLAGGNIMGENEKGLINIRNNEHINFDEIFENEISYAPQVNIYETRDEFVLIANMPGVSRENVHLRLVNGAIVLFGRTNYTEEKDRTYLLNEREIGNYYRKFKLADSIDHDKIEAKYENGQLIINLPKFEDAKPRNISIS